MGEQPLRQESHDRHESALVGMANKLYGRAAEREPEQSKNSSLDAKAALRVAKPTYFYRADCLGCGDSMFHSTQPKESSMSRQKLLGLVASIAILAVTACTDMTGPANDGPAPCPVSGGPDCGPH